MSWLGKFKCFHEREECVKVSQCKIKFLTHLTTTSLGLKVSNKENKTLCVTWERLPILMLSPGMK